MKTLYLEDLKDLTEAQIKKHLVSEYNADEKEVNKYKILLAYESVGSWGCDSSSFFLLQEKKTKKLFEVHGSHCSCYGFEDQFTPELSDVKYLKSEHFGVSLGGYDNSPADNERLIKEYCKAIK
jgi:hypothetical protein